MAERIPNLITGVTAKFPSALRAPAPKSAAQPAAIVLNLPFPPSVNHYWRHHGHVVYISKAGKQYRKTVSETVGWKFENDPIDYQVAVLIEARAPNKRSWDPDNRIKALLDALTFAGVWADDKLVRDVRIVDRGVESPGSVVVSIRRFDANQ